MLRLVAPRTVQSVLSTRQRIHFRNFPRQTKLAFSVGIWVGIAVPFTQFNAVHCAAGSSSEGENSTVRTAGDLSVGGDPAKSVNDLNRIRKGVDEHEDEQLFFDTVLSAVGPTTAKFGFGGILGYCTGYAMKQASKVAMVVVGASVVTLQVLQYCGYVEVRWDNIKRDVVGKLDSDQSGRIGFKDFKYYARKMMSILKYNGPTAGGFSTGVYLGFYKG